MFTLKNSCVYMNNSPFINNKGQLKLCCKNNTYTMEGNIKTHSLKEMYFSSLYNELRDKMLAEKVIEGCDICYSQEARNEDSFRIRALTNITREDRDKIVPLPKVKIQNLDLRIGSTCNLMCSMCHPTDSSKWYANYETFAKEVHNKSDNHVNIIKSTNIPTDLNWATYDESWDNIFKSIDDELNFVYIAGGEPFYIKKFPEYLTHLIEKSPNAIIEINTNSTAAIPEKYLDKLKGKLQLRISIDGFRKTEEYQRAGTNWNEKIKIIDSYSKYFEIKCFDITLTSFTIRSLPSLVSFLENRYPKVRFLFRPVVNRQGQDIRCVPKKFLSHVKTFCKEKQEIINENKEMRWHYKNINQILNFLNQDYIDEKETLQKLVKYWDDLTGIHFKSFDTEFGNWINENHSS